MTSMIINIFENNFFEKCNKNSFLNTNCIIGSSTLFFSLLILITNIFALFKLARYYGKINFETNLFLFSILQVILIQLVIITSYEILIECFNFIQILIITLIIRKFVILSKQSIQQFKKNALFIFLNTINIPIFILYIMFLFENNKEKTYSLILIHTLFYVLSSFILSIYSNSLVKLINKFKKYNINATSSKSTSNSSKETPDNINTNSNNVAIMNTSNYSNNEIFYTIRKKQIKPLYIINFTCSFLEFGLIFSLFLIPYGNFEQNQFKIIPNSLLGFILFYVYIVICLFNVTVNFICFFWRIREQFKENYSKSRILKSKRRIIDNRYIKRETINMKNEDPEQINEFIENDSIKNDSKKYAKSIYMSSFTDISEDKNDDYFVKPPNHEDNIENNEIKNNNNNDDNINFDNNNETIVNKELLVPLNNNNFERESIPSNINSIDGINRNTTFSVSKID